MRGRFVAGDPLRGIGVVAICAYHMSFLLLISRPQPEGAGPAYQTLLLAMQPSVYMFFTLSGYLISYPYMVGSGRPLGEYSRNRVLRIVPAFWVVAAAVLLWFGFNGSTVGEVVALFAFAQTLTDINPMSVVLAQAWTLGAEALYYVLVPLTAALFAGRRAALVVTCLAAVALASLAWRVYGPDRLLTAPTPPSVLWAFAPGVALAAVQVRWAALLRGVPWGSLSGALVFAAGVMLCIAHVEISAEDVGAKELAACLGGSLIVAGPLLYQWTGERTWRWLDNRPVHEIGQRSYSIYLLHLPVVYVLKDLYDETRLGFSDVTSAIIAYVVLMVVLTELLHRGVERPFLRRIRRRA